MIEEITIPVSPEQKDAIMYCVLMEEEIGMVPDERVWMVTNARKKHPDCKVTAADLDSANMQWLLTIERPDK